MNINIDKKQLGIIVKAVLEKSNRDTENKEMYQEILYQLMKEL